MGIQGVRYGMTGETAREISANPEGFNRLANYLPQQCFAKYHGLRICMPGLLRTRRSAITEKNARKKPNRPVRLRHAGFGF